MHEEQISESLQKVYVLFEKGKIRPRVLLWGTRRYKVVQINSSWIDRSRKLPRHGFSLTVDSGEIFQVLYEGNAAWKLEYILTGRGVSLPLQDSLNIRITSLSI